MLVQDRFSSVDGQITVSDGEGMRFIMQLCVNIMAWIEIWWMKKTLW